MYGPPIPFLPRLRTFPHPRASPGLAVDHFRSPSPGSAGPSVSASSLPLSSHDHPADLGLATNGPCPHSPLDHFSFLISIVRPNIQVAKSITHLQQTEAHSAARPTKAPWAPSRGTPSVPSAAVHTCRSPYRTYSISIFCACVRLSFAQHKICHIHPRHVCHEFTLLSCC